MNLSKKELRLGAVYMVLSLAVLPLVLALLPLPGSTVNILYYCINFLAVIAIFRRFLKENAAAALDRPFMTLYYAALGYLGYEALTQVVTTLILLAFPDFANVNDQNITAMFLEHPQMMTVSVVFLVPLAEECFFRGVLFNGIRSSHPRLAWLISMAAFALVHVAGYIGVYDPLRLGLCFLQYLPAGYCLCFVYRRSGTILTPIFVHTIVNALGVYNAVR